MYRQILESINGVEIYPLISFVIFMTVFLFISYKALRMEQSSAKELAYLPLEDNERNAQETKHGR